MGFLIAGRQFNGGSQEPEEKLSQTWHFVDEDGPQEISMLNEKDSINFLNWMLEHREEAAKLFEDPKRHWWQR